MYNNEINRLNFENWLWILFIGLCIMNIYGDEEVKKYIETNDKVYENDSNKIFEITLIITSFIYIYFFVRNYNAYKKVSEDKKELYMIKLLGSSFLLAGIICLLYFQTRQSSFIGSPAL